MKGDHKRLYNLLRLIRTLRETRMSAKRLGQRYGVDPKTITRYIAILKKVGFAVEHEDWEYYIPEAGADAFHAPFTQEESGFLKDALLEVHPRTPFTSDLLKKLDALSDLEEIAELITDKQVGQNIRNLARAIRDASQVRLMAYHSLHGDSHSDRLVEPIHFTVNYRYVYAYEPASGQVKQFKPERMEEVEVLDCPFQHEKDHQRKMPDVFGMCSTPECLVSLQLKPRAYHLLLEEFPDVRTHWEIERNGDHHHATIPVKGFEGVGRFVLGLPGEVEVLGPRGFLDYLEEKRKRGSGQKISEG